MSKIYLIFILLMSLSAQEIQKNIFTPSEIQYIKEKKNFKVCIHKNHYPTIIINKKEVTGTSMELLKLISQKTGLSFETLMSENIPSHLQMLKDGACDISPIVVTKPNRFDFLEPTIPIISDHIVLVTRINEPYVDNLNTLKDKKIAILKGAKNLILYVKSNYPDLNLIEMDNFDVKRILKGEFYGHISPSYKSAYLIATEYFNELKIMSRIGEKKLDGSFGITIREPLLLSIFNKTLSTISPLEMSKIQNAWLRVEVQEKFDYIFFAKVMSAVALIIFTLLFFYLKQRKLHKKIKILHDTLEIRVKEEVEKNKQQQLALFHQSRLAQMGEIIQSITHQWRQPLAQINSAVLLIDSYLQNQEIDNKQINAKLSEIESTTLYMSQTVNDFQYYFNPKKEKQYFYIKTLLQEALSILKTTIKNTHIEIVGYGCNTCQYLGYKNELQQVIIVLLNNAQDALKTKAIKNPRIYIEIINQNSEYEISISDNAGGINKDIIHKIFEPYFTTKHQSQGTGLGLYLAKMIITDAMQGKLIYNNTNIGACFTIKLLKEEKNNGR